MVNLGGNVYAHGKKSDKSMWKVGIIDPRNSSSLIGSVSVSDKFVVTSGDYERYIEIDGIRYHHIIDAKTGYPADTGLIGVTVISDNGFEADCLSTSCFLVGYEDGVRLSEKYNADVIFVTEDMKVFYPEAIDDIFDKTSTDYEYIKY